MRISLRTAVFSALAAASLISGAAVAQGGVRYTETITLYPDENDGDGKLYAALAAKCEAQGLSPSGFVVTSRVHDGYGLVWWHTGEITCVGN
ncbi:hypothetical protein [Lysobacter enzymogenes]|uniref:hypothetical protein n=1 Tax=Lysobacter enzymogenes TaxID=69 RepID=UPI001AF61F8C|nr:hypothetical protein [Lysobacter enzymogenes]QQP99440.1 hypothetical protein JHW41_15070 [Lysobacter enzymogenes]